MRKIVMLLSALALSAPVFAQVQPGVSGSAAPVVLTLDKALEIALSENVSVRVADMEIQRSEYAKKGSYAALLPQVDASASYMRTIKKQVMYMDGDGFDFGSMIGESLAAYLFPLYAQHPGLVPPTPSKPEEEETSGSSNEGFSVGRWNTFSGGVTMGLPLVNAQLWESLRISSKDVELAVEKARNSRLETVTQVKQAFFSTLLAKEAFNVYKEVYENALENFHKTEMRYNVQKASELDYTRAKTTVVSAIPNVYEAECSVNLALWQLKAVMGVDLDMNIDVAGALEDYAQTMFRDIHEHDDFTLEGNSSLRQLEIQAEELASTIRLQKFASLPSLSLAFSFTQNAMTNDFNFSTYQWSPYSYVGLSLNIPIFAGGKRFNAVRQAKVQYSQLALQKDNAERQLRIAIRQYLNQMETGMKSYDSAQSALESAHKAYDIATKSYNVGRSTLTDLNDARLALTQTQLGVSQTIYNYLVAKSNLEQTLGYDFTE